MTQTQQNYNDAKSILMKSIKDIMTPEEIKEELRNLIMTGHIEKKKQKIE